jgi:Spy/CpxP family protein refolding chaperone
MSLRFLNRITLLALLWTATAAVAQNQGHMPPGGGPPPGGPPGGYNPNPNAPAPASSTHNAASTSARTSDTAHSGFQFGPVGRWWDDRSVIQAIGLRHEQQLKMDAIFKANKPAIEQNYKVFLTEQAKLNKLNSDPGADQNSIFAAIDAVAKARTSLQKATTQMLLQIRQQMDAEQITRLEKLK